MSEKNLKIIAMITLGLAIAAAAILLVQSGDEKKTVVVYTSVDQIYSEPVFRTFENETGIRIMAVYDVEATKTTGLVNRLIAEKSRPQADVFWSGEFSQTIVLKNRGLLASYQSPSAVDIPARFKDSDGYWTGFGGRARIFIVNTDLLTPSNYPHSLYDMMNDTYPGTTVSMAYPMFGTTATHAAALYRYLGNERAHAFFSSVYNRNIRIVDGNSVVRDLVADGQIAFGLTDTDDACGARESGKNVTIIIPDQGEGDMGTLVIPNTVALIKDGPHPEDAKTFMDYLLDRKREAALVESGWIQIPVRDIPASACITSRDIRTIPVTYQDTYDALQTAQEDLITLFIR